ncbi:IclR family transcriptional regulator [Amycolatopsis orientalis]|uniref:IclR family transcriptional regulator n=1 Tax=Amycolatopsis orientalis TaxID=31958 RepID=UPI0003A23CE8|nr:IclR family transcriptional regulator [Amycolatopsis orientalis]
MIDGLERAVRMLDLFSSDTPEWTVADVCAALDLPKTTVWDGMQSMVDLGLLRRTGRGRYRLGWRSFQLGLRSRATSEISGPAWTEMRALVDTHHQTVQLATRYRGEVVYLEKIAPHTGVRVNATRPGERLPAHCTAVGKVLLARLSPSDLRDVCGEPKPRTPRSITTLAELETELSSVRQRGYALDVGEAVEGMCCVAAPISNRHGDVPWALSMSFPEHRRASHGDAYLRDVLEATRRLSEHAP